MSQKEIDRLYSEYMAQSHRIQTGIGFEMGLNQNEGKPCSTRPKSLRTGINMNFVGQAALASLLIEKGVFTELEYNEAMRAAATREADRIQDDLSKRTGTKITLV